MTIDARGNANPPHSEGYETSDVSAPAVLYAALAFFVGIGVSVGLVFGVLAVLTADGVRQHAPSPMSQQSQSSSPRLEVAPAEDRALLETAAASRLQGYRWVDQKKGIARIPIERAMRMLVDRGWPDIAGKAGTP